VTPFRDISIGEKLMRLAVLASAVSLLAASAAFVVFDLLTMRGTLVRRLTTAADIVGYNSVSPLLFQDEEAAAKTLEALRAEPHVLGAAIYAKDGRLFAVYHRAGERGFVPPQIAASLPASTRFGLGRLELVRPVDFEGSPGGTVLIVSDLSEITQRLLRYGALVLLVSLTALGVAVSISARFQREVSEPLLALARTAGTVSEARDYSVRAAPAGRDEIGLLVDTFNDMLAQIQRRDTEVEEARASLERRVEERTHDLMRELAERRRAEDALRKSEALLADAQRISGIGSFEWDAASNRTFWSDEHFRLFDVERGAFEPTLGVVLERIHPDDRAAFRASIDEAFGAGGPVQQTYDYRIVRADGSVRWLHGNRRLERGEDGTPVRVVGFTQDVTERRAAQDQRDAMIRMQAARGEAETAERRAAFNCRILATTADRSAKIKS